MFSAPIQPLRIMKQVQVQQQPILLLTFLLKEVNHWYQHNSKYQATIRWTSWIASTLSSKMHPHLLSQQPEGKVQHPTSSKHSRIYLDKILLVQWWVMGLLQLSNNSQRREVSSQCPSSLWCNKTKWLTKWDSRWIKCSTWWQWILISHSSSFQVARIHSMRLEGLSSSQRWATLALPLNKWCNNSSLTNNPEPRTSNRLQTPSTSCEKKLQRDFLVTVCKENIVIQQSNAFIIIVDPYK